MINFNFRLGDRVARKPERPKEATTDFTEAFVYASMRAVQTGRHQYLRQHMGHGWWIVINGRDKEN